MRQQINATETAVGLLLMFTAVPVRLLEIGGYASV